MTAVKRAASERLHQFAAETGLFAANTGNEPKESRYSFAGTWRLPGVGHDGREKLYQLDYTFMCPKSWNAEPLVPEPVPLDGGAIGPRTSRGDPESEDGAAEESPEYA